LFLIAKLAEFDQKNLGMELKQKRKTFQTNTLILAIDYWSVTV